ncbi:type II secretion system secretin GspD [Aquincola sp. S2]|uniref:Type II secretion system secretin GspD n=1 Tax=Pseudaquabacterium terrae TaxID=2732868 RepID=A0ABX2ED00_9BURK|nr:type II secretion system secretin GspD [Aquabacterium terrae]NRF66581.1 type II secretion system secretin GspD [Aquabacterium terrae]
MRVRPFNASALTLACLLALSTFSADPVQAQQPARSAQPRFRSNAPVTLNFVNADIEAVSRAMSAMIDQPILVDPRVKGSITVYSEQPIPVREAWLNYLASLRGLGFALVDSNGLLKVVPEAEAKLQTGTVVVGPTEQRGDQVLTQVFRLNHENPNNLVAVLRPLISPNNTINANPGTSSLVITDYADNLARLGRIIAALDQPTATEVDVIPLQHAVAADVAALVQKIGEGAATAAPGVPGATAATSIVADARSNSLIVRAANPARLATIRGLVARLDRPSDGPAGSIYVVHLKNADATKLASVLRAAFGGGSGSGASSGPSATSATTSPMTPQAGGAIAGSQSAAAATPVAASAQPSTGGFIQADPATNSLIITAAEPLYRQMRVVIDQLDGRRAQVFVESMIVEMDAQKAAEFGFQWQGLLGNKGDGAGLALGTNFGSGANNIINLSSTTSLANVNVGANVNGLNLGLLTRVNGIYTLGALARFLETVSGTNILSTPNLVALDNEEAKIVVGQNVPFVTGSFTNTGASSATVNPFQTVERKDVGLTLRVKPQIGEGGVVRMTVYQENSAVVSASARDTNGPTTTKSSIETTVVVDDGAIMVLGGQLKDQFDDGESKVPLLGDIPLVGGLFRSENRKRAKSNLLVFLRPVVIRDAQTAQSLTVDRYESIRALQKNAQPASGIVMPNTEPVMLPPLGPAPAPVPAPIPK